MTADFKSDRSKTVCIGHCPDHGPYVILGSYNDEPGDGDHGRHQYFGCPEIVGYDGETCYFDDPSPRTYVALDETELGPKEKR